MRQTHPSGKLKLSLVAIAVSQLFSFSAYAAQTESERIAELEKKLEKSLTLIEQLSTRLSQVEGNKVAAPAQNAVAEKIATQEGRLDQLETSIIQVSENSAKRHNLGVPLHGFADVGYGYSSDNPKPPKRRGGFALGNLDIYLTPEFGRFKSIIELVFEFGPESSGVATDLERLQFGYTFSDAATLWAGRFHAPFGFWHTAFHHGQQIQTAAARPRFLEFEDLGGFLPTHAVGLHLAGSVRAGEGKVQYDAYVANGDRISEGVLDFNAFQDDNANKLVGGNLRYAFGGALEGLTLGAHGFTQKVDDDVALANNSTRTNMLGAFVVLDKGNWEVMSEYYRFRNKDLSGGTGTHSSWAGFAQAGYTFGETFTPFLRFEKASLDQSDHYFDAQESGRSYQRKVLGLRYNLNEVAALKVELNQTKEEQRDLSQSKTNEARLQVAVRF